VQGTIEIDTSICRFFPTGGSVSYCDGDETTIISFDSLCDGTFDYSTQSDWDFVYEARDPYAEGSQTYIEGTSNAVLEESHGVHFWQPEVGGETLADSVPGTVIYRFPFASPVEAAQVGFRLDTFHWDYSQGHCFVYGSKDGSSWVLLTDIPPPAWGEHNAGGMSLVPPAGLLGGTELWIKIELYAYGPRADEGGSLTNTAELARYDPDKDNVTARVEVNLQD
jgi:hypothetical protein